MEMETSILVEGLTKTFDGKPALSNVSFHVERGEVFGYLGPNGAGKSTTIKILSGLLEQTSGRAVIDGLDNKRERVEIKKRIGVVPETSNLYPELSVYDNLRFVSRLYQVPRAAREEKIGSLLDMFGLKDYRNRGFGKLSKGLKRRVVLAAALVHDPDIVFLDEPTSGLDIMSARNLRKMIQGFKQEGVTVFLTTHYIEEAEELCDRVAILVGGRIVKVGTPGELEALVRETPILEASLKASNPLGIQLFEGLPADEVTLQGDKVRVYTSDVSEAIYALSQLSKRHGFEITEINTLQPSLEEAFVKLTGLSSEEMRSEKEGKP
ncbi:MAG: ABC transporter ATP-binding protein [Aquificota bacterium]|nr:MAG: ABC transporter ATP-binding protein [Aquificota bacterium]